MLKLSYYVLFLSAILFITGCDHESSNPSHEKEAMIEEEKDQTTKDLEFALSGESQANRKYTAFAEIADKEGFDQIARLWRAAAAAEAVHAKNHMKALGLLNSTEKNLEGAVEGEQYEFETMYPRFIKTAEDAGRLDAAKSMEWAFTVEQLHHKMFMADLEDIQNGKQPKNVVYWICDVCGNTIPENPPEKCDICGSPKKDFFLVK